MAVANSRQSFAELCLRRLGAGAINIDITDDQLDDRIDEALNYYYEYHHSGSEKVYLSHQLTANDISNKYLTIDDDIISVVNIFDFGTAFGSQNLFSLSYQFAQSDFMASVLRGSMVPYWMVMSHVELIQQILVGKQMIRYNRNSNRLYIDMDWTTKAVAGQYVVLEGYRILDADTNTDVWKDRWLLMYTCAIIKRQWAGNLGKFANMTLAGGQTFNAQKLWDEAQKEIDQLEASMIRDFSLPVYDILG